VAAACKLGLPPPGPVPPSGDDRGYVLAVRGAYRIYREPTRLAPRYLNNAFFALKMLIRGGRGP